MRTYKYIGIFTNDCGDTHELVAYCNNFFHAFFLLTAEAISRGDYYQLDKIKDEKGIIKFVYDINKCKDLLSDHPPLFRHAIVENIQPPCEHTNYKAGHSPTVACICNDCGKEI